MKLPFRSLTMLASEQFIDSEDETLEELFEGDEDADGDADADDEPGDLLQGDEVTEDGEEVCVCSSVFFPPSTHVFNVTNRNQPRRTMMMMTTTTKRTRRKTRMKMKSLYLMQAYKIKGLQSQTINLLHCPLNHHLLLKNAYYLLLNRAEMSFSFIWTNHYLVLTPLKPYLPYPIPFQLTLLLPRLAYPTFSPVLTTVISETMMFTPL